MASSLPHSGDWLAAPAFTSVGLRLSGKKSEPTDLTAERASLINVHVAEQLMHGVFTVWRAKGVRQDNSATTI